MKKFFLILFIPFLIFPNNLEEEIQKHLKYLSSKKLEGRMTGSEGAKKASLYIENNLKKINIETITQKFPFVSGVLLGKNNFVSLKYKEKEMFLKLNKDYKPLSYSSSGEIEGTVVFAGYGISAKEIEYDDYEGIDVEGKIVLIFRYNPSGKNAEDAFSYYDRIYDKIITARERGAKAVIIFTGAQTEKEEKIKPFKKEAGTDLGILTIQISQKKAKEIFKLAGYDIEKIEKEIIEKKKPNSFEIQKLSLKIKIELKKEKKECQNIIGFIKPGKWNGKYILLGAHYDHIGLGGETSRWEKKFGKIHPGADDNASGTSLLIELSKALSKEKEKLNYALIFAFFSGEELGIIGSSYFTKNPPVNLSNIALMLNFDMVGRMKNNKLILLGVDTSPKIEPILDKISLNYNFEIIKNMGGFSQGDNTAFYKENIPVLGFFTDIHPDYHLPTDTYDKINYSGIKEILNFAKDIILEFQKIANIDFTPSKAIPKEGGKSAMKVYVGTIPAFGEEIEGYKISGVQPGSPAEKGGLKKDDIIIKINGKEIKNIYDYMSAFKDKKGGDEVVFEILRGEEILSKKIILESSKSKEKWLNQTSHFFEFKIMKSIKDKWL